MKKTDVQNIMNLMWKNNNLCQGSPQQVANGFYRAVEMLDLFITSLDEEQKYQTETQNLITLLNRNNAYCQGAAQQSANGSYRIVELLDVLIKMLDKDGSKRSDANAIVTLMNRNNSYCQGAPQQIANGAYRIVEMLQIVIHLVEPSLDAKISSRIAEMNRMNGYCQSAPQQLANGTCAITYIVRDFVEGLDKENQYRSEISSIIQLRDRNNSMCQGADQQSANNIYRTMELLQILSNIRIAELELRIKAYWDAHEDEKVALLMEKADLLKKVKEIEKEASAVNDGGKIAEIKKVISGLEAESNAYGKEDVAAIEKEITALKGELASIGFFKFSDKKVVKEKIEQVENRLRTKQNEVKQEQAKYGAQINQKNQEIDKIQKQVEDEKNAILKKCVPHKNRMDSIDFELTRQR